MSSLGMLVGFRELSGRNTVSGFEDISNFRILRGNRHYLLHHRKDHYWWLSAAFGSAVSVLIGNRHGTFINFLTSFKASDMWFLAQAAYRTLLISGISISLGSVLGLIFGWLLYEGRLMSTIILSPFLDIFRSVPLIIQLVLVYNFAPIIGLYIDPFGSGAIVLTIYTTALVANVVRGGIDSVGIPLRHAARSLGLSYWQDMFYIVAPIGIRAVFPAWVGVALWCDERQRSGFRAWLPRVVKGFTDSHYKNSGTISHTRTCWCILFRTFISDCPIFRTTGEKVESMIEIRGLHKYFGRSHVLKGIDLDVKKGEVLSIIGASGSGKSTLLLLHQRIGRH